ncbi:hypothetical protein SVIO_090440 [Streptomyces violaceusniger]|uniref:Acyl-CoA dehydrogenase/oxidase C-terminal domain-containing protein n=1 Tax=Streptomyces violaceusniger TaxID=68280 RepID=A0A4D4LA22_STRVO|nr:hypothetical protein SVIO_090440 [Streptomyces violaceusniger]
MRCARHLGDAPLSRLYREVRPFRIYDGPSETHRWAIAKRAVRATRERRDTHHAVEPLR